MKRFKTIRKNSLANAQHQVFMTEFGDDLSKISGAPEKLQAAITEFGVALDEELRCVKKPRGSLLTEKIREADTIRDLCYSKLRRLVKVWLGTAIEPQDSAAAAVKRVIDKYRLDTAAQQDEESGRMDHLLDDLGTEVMRADIVALDAAGIVSRMREANDNFYVFLRQRDHENVGWSSGALRRARSATDRAYLAVTDAIEAFNYVYGGYDDFITTWNSTVAHYKAVIRRKKAGKKAGGDEP